MPISHKQLLSTQDVLEILDETLTKLSQYAVEYVASSKHLDLQCCQSEWEALEKAAGAIMQARVIDQETLASISIGQAEKNLIRRAVALMECIRRENGNANNVIGLRSGSKVSSDDWSDEEA